LGFLIVTGHGIPAALVQHTCDEVLHFFDQPIEERLKLSSPNGG
jgi:isopenicillin N synthase-like dioxygenase